MDEQLLLEVISRAETAGLEQVKDMLNQNTDAYEKMLNIMESGSGVADQAAQAQQGLTEAVRAGAAAQRAAAEEAAQGQQGIAEGAQEAAQAQQGLTEAVRAGAAAQRAGMQGVADGAQEAAQAQQAAADLAAQSLQGVVEIADQAAQAQQGVSDAAQEAAQAQQIAADLAAQAQQGVTEALDQVSQAQQGVTDAAGEAAQAQQGLTEAVRAGAAAQKTAVEEVARAQRAAMEEAAQAQRDMIEPVGKWSTAQKVGMGVVAGAATGLLAVAMGGMRELSGLTREYRAQTGATADEAKKAIEVTREYYRTTTMGYGEIMGVVQGLRQELGITEDKASDLTGQIIMFAQATGMNAEQGMGLLTRTLKAFNLPASEMASVMDKIISASQKTGQGVSQLGGSLSMLAPTLARANMGMDEGIAFMEMFKAAGINASMAPRLLMMALNKVKSPEQFQRMLKDIQSTENDAQRAAKAVALFGSRGAAMGLVLKPGAKTLEDWTRELQGLGPVTKTAADIMNSSLGTKLQILFKNAQDRVVEFGQKYGQVVMTISTLGTAVVGVARQLNVDLVGALSSATMKVASAAKNIGASIVGGIMPKVGWAADLVVSIASGIKDLAGSAIVGVAKAAGAVIGGAYRLAVAAAGKVVDLVSGAWEMVSKSTVIRAIVSTAGSIVGGLYGAAVNLAAQASDFIASTWQEVTGNAAVKAAAVAAGEVVGFLYSSALNLTAQLSEFVANSFASLGGSGAVATAVKSVAAKFGAIFALGTGGAAVAGAAGGEQFANAFVGGVDDSGFEAGLTSSLYADLTGRTISGEIGRAARSDQRAFVSSWMDGLAPKLSAGFGRVFSAITFPARLVATEAKFAASLVKIIAGGFAQSGRAIGDLLRSTLGKALAGVSGVSGALNLKGLLSGLTGQSKEVGAGLGAHLKSIWAYAGAIVAPAASLAGKAGVAAYQLGTAAAEKIAGFGAMLASGWKRASALVVAEARLVGFLAILAHGEAVRLGGQIGDLLAPLWLKSKAAVALAAQQVGFVGAYAHGEAVLLKGQIAHLLAGLWAKVGPIVMPIANAVGTAVGLAYERGVNKAQAVGTALSTALSGLATKLGPLATRLGIGTGAAVGAGMVVGVTPPAAAAGAVAGGAASATLGTTFTIGSATAVTSGAGAFVTTGMPVFTSAGGVVGTAAGGALTTSVVKGANTAATAAGAAFIKGLVRFVGVPIVAVLSIVGAIKYQNEKGSTEAFIKQTMADLGSIVAQGEGDYTLAVTPVLGAINADEFLAAQADFRAKLEEAQGDWDWGTQILGDLTGNRLTRKQVIQGGLDDLQKVIDEAVGQLPLGAADALTKAGADADLLGKIALTVQDPLFQGLNEAAKVSRLAALSVPEGIATSLISGTPVITGAANNIVDAVVDPLVDAAAKLKAIQLGMDPAAIDKLNAQRDLIRKAQLGDNPETPERENVLVQSEIDRLDKATKILYYAGQGMSSALAKGYVEGLDAEKKAAVDASEKAKNAWWQPFTEMRSKSKGLWDSVISSMKEAQSPAERAMEILAISQSAAYIEAQNSTDPTVKHNLQLYEAGLIPELKNILPKSKMVVTDQMKKMGETFEATLPELLGRVRVLYGTVGATAAEALAASFGPMRKATRGLWDAAVSATKSAQSPAQRAAELVAQLTSKAYINGVKSSDPEAKQAWIAFGTDAIAELNRLIPAAGGLVQAVMDKMGETFTGSAPQLAALAKAGIAAPVIAAGKVAAIEAGRAGVDVMIQFALGLADKKKQAEGLTKALAEAVKHGWTSAQWSAYWKKYGAQAGLIEKMNSDKPEVAANARSMAELAMDTIKGLLKMPVGTAEETIWAAAGKKVTLAYLVSQGQTLKGAGAMWATAVKDQKAAVLAGTVDLKTMGKNAALGYLSSLNIATPLAKEIWQHIVMAPKGTTDEAAIKALGKTNGLAYLVGMGMTVPLAKEVWKHVIMAPPGTSNDQAIKDLGQKNAMAYLVGMGRTEADAAAFWTRINTPPPPPPVTPSATPATPAGFTTSPTYVPITPVLGDTTKVIGDIVSLGEKGYSATVTPVLGSTTTVIGEIVSLGERTFTVPVTPVLGDTSQVVSDLDTWGKDPVVTAQVGAAGAKTTTDYAVGMINPVAVALVTTNAGIVAGKAAAVFDPSKNTTYPWQTYGANVMGAWTGGILSKIKGLPSEMRVALRDAFAAGGAVGASAPKVGPLRDIGKWGFNIGTAWVEGVVGGISDKASITSALASLSLEGSGLTAGRSYMSGLTAALSDTEMLSKAVADIRLDAPTVPKVDPIELEARTVASMTFQRGSDVDRRPISAFPIAPARHDRATSDKLLAEVSGELRVHSQLLSRLVTTEPLATTPVSARGALARQQFLSPGGRA